MMKTGSQFAHFGKRSAKVHLVACSSKLVPVTSISVSCPRCAVIGRQRRDVIVRRKCATGHVLLLLLLCDIVVADGRQVVVMQQPLQVTDVVNGTSQRLYL